MDNRISQIIDNKYYIDDMMRSNNLTHCLVYALHSVTYWKGSTQIMH